MLLLDACALNMHPEVGILCTRPPIACILATAAPAIIADGRDAEKGLPCLLTGMCHHQLALLPLNFQVA